MLFDHSDRMDMIDQGKYVNHTYSSKNLTPNASVAPASTREVEYGMPSNYFAGYILSHQPQFGKVGHSSTQSDQCLGVWSGQTSQTDQSSAMVLATATLPPLAPILSSAAPGQTDELESYVLLYTTKSYGEPPF